MPPQTPIQLPAGFAPAFALGYSDENGDFVLAKASSPFPVASGDRTRPEPLKGTTLVSILAGPFSPVPGISVMLELSGSWSGTVQLRRSSDGGATMHDVTLAGAQWGNYAANACEPVWEESEPGAELYLDIAINSGTLTYRVSQ
ncbi:hypothetical protein [Altererythrobacter sp. MF3-039]|uniref:hypothetical protein n=1 Tax=Altererythrobacter sp. MF3-039 TaxID=3252901 RepID=UPI00390C56F1